MDICSSFFQPALEAVLERGDVHRAGVDLAHRVLKGLEPGLQRAEVHAEHGLILAREGVAEAVLQEAGGAHDYRALAVIGEHGLELLADVLREAAGEQGLFELLGLGEIALGRALLYPRAPAVVADDVGVKDVGAYIEGVVRLSVLAELGQADFGYLARKQHAAGLAAYGAGAYHAVA